MINNKTTRVVKKAKRNTWRTNPKIINKVPYDEQKLIMYVDESGEGNKKVLKRSFEAKKNNEPYQQRNDLYILNGVVLSGHDSFLLKNRMEKFKRSIIKDGIYCYPGKGTRPIVLRNSDINSHKAPFDHLNLQLFEYNLLF